MYYYLICNTIYTALEGADTATRFVPSNEGCVRFASDGRVAPILFSVFHSGVLFFTFGSNIVMHGIHSACEPKCHVSYLRK